MELKRRTFGQSLPDAGELRFVLLVSSGQLLVGGMEQLFQILNALDSSLELSLCNGHLLLERAVLLNKLLISSTPSMQDR